MSKAKDKKTCLRNTIMDQVDIVLNGIEAKGDIDHFELQISNHKGTVQTARTEKARTIAY